MKETVIGARVNLDTTDLLNDVVKHSMVMGYLNKSRETMPTTTTALKVQSNLALRNC